MSHTNLQVHMNIMPDATVCLKDANLRVTTMQVLLHPQHITIILGT